MLRRHFAAARLAAPFVAGAAEELWFIFDRQP